MLVHASAPIRVIHTRWDRLGRHGAFPRTMLGMTDKLIRPRNDQPPLRGNIRVGGYRRVSHGLYLPIGVEGDEREEQLRDLSAWRLVLPADAVFTHITAADLCGWWLPKLPRFVPVFAASGLAGNIPRRAGVVCSRLARDHPTGIVDGLPVDSAYEILLRAARDLALIDLVVMLDSALRLGHVTSYQLDEYCHSGRPGSRRLRHAAALSDSRSESAWETILRLFHNAVDIDVEPQRRMYDETGRFAGRVDLWVKGTPGAHEYDGDEHEKAQRRKTDLRRARRLLDAGVERRGYVADDLLNHPRAMLQEMDRELGRPHRPARLRKWYAWLRESSYSVAGRRRLQNRWLKVNGLDADWGETA